MVIRFSVVIMPAIFAVYMPFCAASVRPTTQPSKAPLASLWKQPENIEGRDLFNGPWPVKRAPDPRATYTLVEMKHHGINPGMTVRDSQNRKWSVKQAPGDIELSQSEAQIEVNVVADPSEPDVRDGFVRFDYRGWHQELVRRRITREDAAWAGHLIAQLSDRQWRDAFRAGGYAPDLAERFIAPLYANIAQAQRLARDGSQAEAERR